MRAKRTLKPVKKVKAKKDKATKPLKKSEWKSDNSDELKEVKFDRSKYVIEEVDSFSDLKTFYKIFWGDIGNCINEFETKYGEISGTIYHRKSNNLVAISGCAITNLTVCT